MLYLQPILCYSLRKLPIIGCEMKGFRPLQLRTLDRHLGKVRLCEQPSDGWVRAVRKALGMSVRQLAERMGVRQQSTSKLEANERDGSITLNSLRKAAEAMD